MAAAAVTASLHSSQPRLNVGGPLDEAGVEDQIGALVSQMNSLNTTILHEKHANRKLKIEEERLLEQLQQ